MSGGALRVLLVSDFYPPVIGGLEIYVQTLGRELARRGHTVTVATLRHPDAPDGEWDEEVRVRRVGSWSSALPTAYQDRGRRFHPPLPDPGAVRDLRRVLAQVQPDVVHCQGWIMYSLLALKRWMHAPLVVTLHDYGLVCPKKTYMRGNRVCEGPAYHTCLGCAAGQYGPAKSWAITSGLRASRPLHGLVDRYLAVSEAVQKAGLQGATGSSLPIDIVPSFVPDDVAGEGENLDRPAFLPPQDGYIMFAGQLSRLKGVEILLEAYAGLRRPAPLVLLGARSCDTPMQVPAGAIVRHDVSHAQVMAAWRHCALAVVPSIWPDPQPLVTFEAMACGKPVVASAIGGLPDVVQDGKTGLLVPPGDVGALRRALQRLLDDPTLRARLGVAGRRHVRQFMAGAVTDRIERVYHEVIEAQVAGQNVRKRSRVQGSSSADYTPETG